MTTMLIAKTHPETGGQGKIPQLMTMPAAFIYIIIMMTGCVGSVSVHKAMRPDSYGREPFVPAC